MYVAAITFVYIVYIDIDGIWGTLVKCIYFFFYVTIADGRNLVTTTLTAS